jgi:hypothetical protein
MKDKYKVRKRRMEREMKQMRRYVVILWQMG